MLVARDAAALEEVAGLVRQLGMEARVVVEDCAREGAVGRVVEQVKEEQQQLIRNLLLAAGERPGGGSTRQQCRNHGSSLHALP